MEELGGYLIGLMIVALISVWMYQDGTKRGMTPGSAGLWSIMNLLLMILALPLYLLTRPKLPNEVSGSALTAGFRVCPRCNLANGSDCRFCKDCGANLRGDA